VANLGVIIGCADQRLAFEIRSQAGEAADVEVLDVLATSHELTRSVVEHSPAIVLLHDEIGPETSLELVRDIAIRRPGSVVLLISGRSDSAYLNEAMTAGARGIINVPLEFDAVQEAMAGAVEWSERMQKLLGANNQDDQPDRSGRATLIAVAGSKGGIGTSTIASHLAWDVNRQNADKRVLLIDLDLEKGDVTSIIAARYRTSIADLAKVSDDLSPRTVTDAIFAHESGLHLLLPPHDIEDIDWVTPSALRKILTLLRPQYDVIIVDVGAHVTPTQSSIVEIADEVVMVVGPNLVSMRAARRNTDWWQQLAVRKPENVHILLNGLSRSNEIQTDAIKQLAPGPMMDLIIPDFENKLEASLNARDPELVREIKWWKAIRTLGHAFNLHPKAKLPAKQVEPEKESKKSRGRRKAQSAQPAPLQAAPSQNPITPHQQYVNGQPGYDPPQSAPWQAGPPQGKGSRERGSVTVEFLGSLPVLLLIVFLIWQLALAGMTFMWGGHAASAAARATSMGQTNSQIRTAAEDQIPSGLHDALQVTHQPGSDEVAVSLKVPLVAPGVLATPWSVDVSRTVVMEP